MTPAEVAGPFPRAQRVRMFPSDRWPARVVLRRGWARAEARPWNDLHSEAHLRVERGNAGFTAGCALALLDAGAPSVISPPLTRAAQGTWTRAGFEHYLDLALLRLELERPIGAPDHLVAVLSADDLDDVVAVDAAAFDRFWRLDRTGMREAIEATASADLLAVRDGEGKIAGFAIVGYGHALSYLQRMAVAPRHQRQGLGRSLVRTSARRARRRGARGMLLNTQRDNEPALRLYETEGCVILPEQLSVLRRQEAAPVA